MPKGIPKAKTISLLCPPVLARLIAQEGSMLGASKAIRAGNYNIQRIARGEIPMSEGMRAKIEGGLHDRSPITTEKRTMAEVDKPPVAIPPWNKKVGTHKYKNLKGKVKSLKLPVDLIALIKQHNGNMNAAGRAAGYSGWNPVIAAVENGKYENKAHARVYAALHGLPLPNGQDESSEADGFTLGIAICIISLAEYERIEDVATILGGTLVTKMSAGNQWIVIYKVSSREKLEKFKKLARRDAKKIVCP